MTRRDPGVFRQSLLQLLEAHPSREEQFLDRFEALRQQGHPVHSEALYMLTHLSFSEPEARKHWQKVAVHRQRLEHELRRDVGLRVAILDYFVNVHLALKSPTMIELSAYERTERSAVSDGLTGLFNQAYFRHALRREVQRGRRHSFHVSVLLFDLDDFKTLNDTRGHLEGDRVLVKTSGLVKQTLREVDIAARYGGEEFAVILPDTLRTGGYVVAERIRRLVEERFRRSRKTPGVTLSGGVATFPDDAASPEELIQKADQGLYRSKADGKNRITLASGERRRHARVQVSHKVTLRGGAAGRIVARTKNVSESGLLLSLAQPVPLGSTVDLVLHRQRGEALDLRGEVVRVQAASAEPARYDVGLRLHDGSPSLPTLGSPGRA
jgi:diguanylate cyclase (GGDEF)-like protein